MDSMNRKGLILISVSLVALQGCSPDARPGDDDGVAGNDNVSGPVDPNAPPVLDGDWYRPGVEATWQWQLQPGANGVINTDYDVDVYDIDLFDAPDEVIAELHAAGRRVVCYFSAGSYEEFRDDAGAFAAEDLGQTLDGFEDERWLDIRSAKVREVMLARLDVAAERGCDCVEPDNVDGYANESGFDLSAEDQLAFNRFIANAARERGLCVGLKNDLDQIPQLVEYFDFSVNEQCHEYDECELLTPFIQAGKPVFNAEYEESYASDAVARGALCEDARALNLRTLVLPLDLEDSFRWSCDESEP
ncbi:MAG: endo alpha-1,4 polygalactosaminidase [Phycisphaerales bacterium]|nr:endo alpha-1,4 polygalactosaminidase [Phycisphaerales bacterium]